MANINLLPWREDLRLERRNEFLTKAALAAALGIAVVVLWSAKVGSDIDEQVYRNEYIQKNIAELNGKIKYWYDAVHASIQGSKVIAEVLIDDLDKIIRQKNLF